MISWLTGKVAVYVCAGLLAVILGMGIWIGVQNIRLNLCKSNLETAEADVARLELQKKTLLALIAEQNKAVESLKTAAAEKAATADQALASARAEALKSADSRKRLAALLGAPTPAGASCVQGVAAVRKELKP